MTDSKNPLRKPVVFLTVATCATILVAVGGYFLMGAVFR